MKYNKEIILKKIKENIPVIDIGIDNFDGIDQDSDILFFDNQSADSIEIFSETTKNKMKEKNLERNRYLTIFILMSLDLAGKIEAKDLCNLLPQMPEEYTISYGFYIIPEERNRMEIIYIGKERQGKFHFNFQKI